MRVSVLRKYNWVTSKGNEVECIPTREDMKPWVKVVPDMMGYCRPGILPCLAYSTNLPTTSLPRMQSPSRVLISRKLTTRNLSRRRILDTLIHHADFHVIPGTGQFETVDIIVKSSVFKSKWDEVRMAEW